MSRTPDQSTADAAARLQAVRAARIPSPLVPTPGDKARFHGRSALLGQVLKRRADPTVSTLLAEYAGRQRAQARVLAAAGPAVFRALSRDLSSQVWPVSFSRGVLTLAVPDESIRFKVDRQLRGGGRVSIQSDLPKVARINVTVQLEPFRVQEQPRQQPTPEELERERWELLDGGSPPTEDGSTTVLRRCPACDAAFAGPLGHNRVAPPGTDARRPDRWVRLRCPSCGGAAEYRVQDDAAAGR